MSKFIGTITDKSYYQEYSRQKGNRLFYYRICPYCEKEAEEGFSDLDGGNRAVALQHKCVIWDDLGMFCRGVKIPPKTDLVEFIFKPSDQNGT